MSGDSANIIRRYRVVAAFVFMGLLSVGYVWYGQTFGEKPAATLEFATRSAEEVIEPVQIRIPRLGVNAPFTEPLGVDTNYEIQVPIGYEEVGYYKYGPAPGELGPAVVLGHVDSYTGPAVFYTLKELVAGDIIEIDREDGTTAVFAVDYLQQHEQAGFPTDRVYSDLDHAGLRLITCSGSFDHGEQRYSHNLIVFATLIDIRENS